ncbi:MAG: hypothetical protein U1F25_14510 [Rubrivivax sp.]
MRFVTYAALAAVAVVLTAPLSPAEARPATRSSTTTYYSQGKPVARSVTQGNTTRYYSHGKPVGKAVTSGGRTTVYSHGKPVTRSGRR